MSVIALSSRWPRTGKKGREFNISEIKVMKWT